MSNNLNAFFEVWNTYVEKSLKLEQIDDYQFAIATEKLKSEKPIFEDFIKYLNSKLDFVASQYEFDFSISLLNTIETLPKILQNIQNQERKMVKAQKKSLLDSARKEEFLDIYVELSQSVFLECARIIAKLIGNIDNKNVELHNLNNGVQYLRSKKIGNMEMSKFADLVNVDIRNARDHSQVSIMHDSYRFFENEPQKTFEVDFYTFEESTITLVVALKSFLTSLIRTVRKQNITISLLIDKYAATNFSRSKWIMSTMLVECTKFEITKTNGSYNRLTIEFEGIDASVQQRSWFLAAAAVSGYDIIQNSNVESVFLVYSNPHSLNSFGAIDSSVIKAYLNDEISFTDVYCAFQKEAAIPELNDEDTNVSASIEFNDIITSDYTVSDISDISVEKAKRLKANVFFAEPISKEDIFSTSSEIVEKLKKLRNLPNPKTKIKNGTMSADIVYFNIYRQKSNTNRIVSSTNENFVANVLYFSKRKYKILTPNSEIMGLKSYQINKKVQIKLNSRWA
ncbi:hypothetical protein [Leuconostoc gasicomitatum]|uniref:hypothetical protein n=2 Tax=Leuconostoc gasicomitatum TaxID=115778 RepID=UPI001CC6B7CB|nr:hypothetical protein [Leuconostoc gasicomitatum]MBZ5969783.1 hypothetical protein [Leuconostoc gasicomitatum]